MLFEFGIFPKLTHIKEYWNSMSEKGSIITTEKND